MIIVQIQWGMIPSKMRNIWLVGGRNGARIVKKLSVGMCWWRWFDWSLACLNSSTVHDAILVPA